MKTNKLLVASFILDKAMSPIGTKRTWRNGRLESASRGGADVGLRGHQVSF
jgi:hypothetical protein